ncbi:uncharacterized protein JCM6883_005470 [Sporobolomyces salmoneus]|uniref:uncharacterized protein n=1 Tax=Sporobolomyces salmoneus TaxID=183962 RepID=UPI00317587E6
MPIPHLPNDVIDEILRYDCFTSGALFRTSLVSRNWLEPSRKTLYFQIDMTMMPIPSFADDIYPLDSSIARYSKPSWQLFSILAGDPRLAALVKELSFPEPSLQSEGSNITTTPQALVYSLLHLLPSATSFRFSTNTPLNSGNFGPFFPHSHQLQSIKVDKVTSEGWWVSISRLPNLRSLEIGTKPLGVPKRDRSDPSTSLVSKLERLALWECTVAQFETLAAGSKTSLRSLRIPVNLVAIDLSNYPNVTDLVIGSPSPKKKQVARSLRIPSSEDETKSFLASLRKSSVAALSISHGASQVLVSSGVFYESIPNSCTRINLIEIPSDETLSSIVEKAGKDSRFSQLGLPASHKTVTKPELVQGVRAWTQTAGIELIWLQRKWYAKSVESSPFPAPQG